MKVPSKEQFTLKLISELTNIGKYKQVGDFTINEVEKLSATLITYFVEMQEQDDEPPF